MELKEYLSGMSAALAFSGGVDSAYLLYEAVKSCADVTAYYVRSEFQPEFEYRDALRLANLLGAKLKMLTLSVLCLERVAANPPDRCYHCKNAIFSEIARAAAGDGYSIILDGTNASDEEDDRPGMRALRELGVRSPLRECALTKPEIRELSRKAGLFTWDKPAYACLATRISTGERITVDKLEKTERAESFLHSLGFSDLRVRLRGNTAVIQLKEEQLPDAIEKRSEILRELKQYYDSVTLDLEVRR